MRYYFAPMEGVTGAVYRQAHAACFPGVDRYYAPFLSPTKDHRLTPKEQREILPEHNRGIALVPQVMTHNPSDFLWAANTLLDLGYSEVNLNLGCPSGTVTAKKKGAGLLADPPLLAALLEEIFARSPLPISIKTRLGMNSPQEFPPLLELFARYPVAELIIHPRVRGDFYQGPVRMDWFCAALEQYSGPVCYNGNLTTRAECQAFCRRFPQVNAVMIGRGLLANPALVRQAQGGPGADKPTLRLFHDTLYEEYCRRFQSVRNAMFHMKEVWFYLSCLFEDSHSFQKQLRKAQDGATYERLVDQLFSTVPLREDACVPWATLP